jgi:flavin reductase (DIM6/NTAB) family NADH-FMN oxidoreductase RutF
MLEPAPVTAADGDEFVNRIRGVHRRYPTGVTVVTTFDEGAPFGLSVNAFSSVSLDPPLALVCIAGSSSTHPRLFLRDHFAVNVLSAAQADLARQFGRPGGGKFEGVSWHEAPNGSPVLDGVCGWFELQIASRMPAATHTIFLGEITSVGMPDAHTPLLYLGGGFYDTASLIPAA